MRKPRYGRPGIFSLLGVMLANLLVGTLVFYLVCVLFKINSIVIVPAQSHGINISDTWGVVLPMLPGIAIGMGFLWYWIVLIGRTKGVQWGGATVYGGLMAMCNVPIAALILCLVNKVDPEKIPLVMLISLALALISPAITVGMLLAGGIMGLFNARLAHTWIAWYKRP